MLKTDHRPRSERAAEDASHILSAAGIVCKQATGKNVSKVCIHSGADRVRKQVYTLLTGIGMPYRVSKLHGGPWWVVEFD